MESISELAAAGLPETVGRFAYKEKGLIVVAGADTVAVRSSAIALARHVQERTDGPLPSSTPARTAGRCRTSRSRA